MCLQIMVVADITMTVMLYFYISLWQKGGGQKKGGEKRGVISR